MLESIESEREGRILGRRAREKREMAVAQAAASAPQLAQLVLE